MREQIAFAHTEKGEIMSNISIENIKSLIQEWFAECNSIVDIANLYHEILKEAETQVDYMGEIIIKDGSHG